MRELTKSMTSYAWAMSVFGVQQTWNLLGLGGNGSWNRSTSSFNHVTEATSRELGDTMRAVFHSGDSLQRGMVDLFLAPLSLGNWGCNGTRDNGNRDSGGRGTGGRDSGGRQGATGATGYRDSGMRGSSSDAWRGGGGGNDRGGSWADTAARTAAAGMDAMQGATETTARVTRQAADAASSQGSSAPPSSDPSLGWGPMPR